MTLKYYPFLLLLEESIEYICDNAALDHALHNLPTEQIHSAICLFENGQCNNLQGHLVNMPSMQLLTNKVRNALILEGECCVDKVVIQTIPQAFALLKQTQ